MTCEREQSLTRDVEGHDWALVLAGGEGTRLQALTRTPSGLCVPKQFCSLGEGPSLLHAALQRARAVSSSHRTCVVVAEHHRRWWQGLRLDLPPENIVAQPFSRGTAHGILLPLLQILHRDPDASLLVLPADHHVRDEGALAATLRQASAYAKHYDRIVLVGVTPEEADPELGYVVSEGELAPGFGQVSAFVEKPTIGAARALMRRGAVWNSFIFAASGKALLRAFEASCSDTVASLRCIIEQSPDPALRQRRIAGIYERLTSLDFSRDVLQKLTARLGVLRAPSCGWSDLGTPRRVAQALARNERVRGLAGLAPSTLISQARGLLDLAASHTELQAAD